MSKKTPNKATRSQRSVSKQDAKQTNDDELLKVFGFLHKTSATGHAQTSQVRAGQSPFDLPPQLNPIFLT